MPKRIINIILLFVFIFRIFGSGFSDVPTKESSKVSFQKQSSEKIPSKLLLFFSETESEESVEDTDEIEAEIRFFDNLFSIILRIFSKETTPLPSLHSYSQYKISFTILFHNLRL